MKQTELNEIIRKKIADLEASEHLKHFIIEILEFERRNLYGAKAHFTKELSQLAEYYSSRERGE